MCPIHPTIYCPARNSSLPVHTPKGPPTQGSPYMTPTVPLEDLKTPTQLRVNTPEKGITPLVFANPPLIWMLE